MERKEIDIKTASVYYELCVPYRMTKKAYQKYVGILSKIADKVDILKRKDGCQFGLMIHNIYYAEGKLDEVLEKLTDDIRWRVQTKLYNPVFTKRKVFFV